MRIKFLVFVLFCLSLKSLAQDTTKYQYPVTPLNSSHVLNATFCEFRNTLSSDHFHNGVDLGKADGDPAYPVMDGEVYYIDNSGSNSYVSVGTNINGKWKRITYLHISPNPSLSVGDQVTTGVTVLGSIYTGMGHIHLIEREFVNHIGDYAAEINSVRQNGGLTPFNDPYPPVISRNSLKFFLDGTDLEIPAHGLTGRIDIRVRIDEHNGTGAVQTNNGTYLAGYRIWSEDTSSIVYEPADSGVKYRFDRMPSNSYVHLVFDETVATLTDPVYWLTNGNGADDINQTQTITNNYFQTSLLDTGNYVLEIFTEDTRGNTDVEYFDIGITDQDLTPPSTSEILSLVNTDQNKSLLINWEANTANDLLGYRLYYSGNNQLSDWQLAADEFQLTPGSTSYFIETPDSFIVAPTQDVYYFKLTAVDSSGNESNVGDIYGRSINYSGQDNQQILIVNGFTRYGGSGSWQNPTHSFVKNYLDALMISDSVVVSSCSNDAILQNVITLGDFDVVVWFVGDESTFDNTFTPAEQNKIETYLENGGKLFVSGSEIGWDLGRTHSNTEPGDLAFYHNYFKADYYYDGTTGMSPASGVAGTQFGAVQLNFGQVYPEDYPDDINPYNGSQLIMNYSQIRSGSTYRKAGVAYTGTFGQGSEPGQLIYLAFPFETVSSLSQRQSFMNSMLKYFGVVTAVENPQENYPDEFSISQNYPNPFNPSTKFTIKIPRKEKVIIKVFDMLGREVQSLINKQLVAGEYTFTWNAENFSSGMYLVKMQAGSFNQSKKVLLLK